MVDSCEENGSFQPIRTLAMDVLPILPYVRHFITFYFTTDTFVYIFLSVE